MNFEYNEDQLNIKEMAKRDNHRIQTISLIGELTGLRF